MHGLQNPGCSAVVVAVAIAAIAGGCALLGERIERVSERAADAVEAYCENFTADQRAEFGELVRARAFPHSVNVTCAGDPAPPE